ncbi:uncharacterized protein V1516DRAFT_254870 [Lipomyces oligophaga]|uniref:uncharacterized protein n=1 Tax=Lipomyces oligophaga TaxID=45792 RepID=UPI0034CD031B
MAPPEPLNSNYNETILELWNYVLYPSNGTLSNVTNCYLSFGSYQPVIYDDGYVNGTTCNSPYYPIRARGGIGIALGVMATALFPLTLTNLTRLGRRLTKYEHRSFRIISRRWQWYWLIVIHALCIAAGFMSIDIDRSYLQGVALTSFGAIFTTICPSCIAAVWEMVRHWCSFEERRYVEDDPFHYRSGDKRSHVHLVMPIVFYLFDFLFFLLTILRNWGAMIKYDYQFAIDVRWKVGVFCGIVAYSFIFIQIYITYKFYRPQRLPRRVPLALLGLAVMIGYSITSSFKISFSPFNPDSNIICVGVWGYLPIVYLILVMNLCAIHQVNDDLVIKAERDIRDRARDQEVMNSVVVRETTDSSDVTITSDYLSSSCPQKSYTVAEIRAIARSNELARNMERVIEVENEKGCT